MNPKFVTREEWGARAPKSTTSFSGEGLPTIHYNGPAMRLKSSVEERAALRGIQRYHMDTKGWSDIAYNFAVGNSGLIYTLRGANVRSAANGTNTSNSRHLAIFLLLGEGETPSSEMISGVNLLLNYLEKDGVLGHRDHKATQCPGNIVYDMIKRGVFTPSSIPKPPSEGTAEYPNTYLKKGSEGRKVKQLQKLLNVILFEHKDQLVVDGDFGAKTEARLIELQSKLGVGADGIYGPVTKLRLIALKKRVAGLVLP